MRDVPAGLGRVSAVGDRCSRSDWNHIGTTRALIGARSLARSGRSGERLGVEEKLLGDEHELEPDGVGIKSRGTAGWSGRSPWRPVHARPPRRAHLSAERARRTELRAAAREATARPARVRAPAPAQTAAAQRRLLRHGVAERDKGVDQGVDLVEGVETIVRVLKIEVDPNAVVAVGDLELDAEGRRPAGALALGQRRPPSAIIGTPSRRARPRRAR